MEVVELEMVVLFVVANLWLQIVLHPERQQPEKG